MHLLLEWRQLVVRPEQPVIGQTAVCVCCRFRGVRRLGALQCLGCARPAWMRLLSSSHATRNATCRSGSHMRSNTGSSSGRRSNTGSRAAATESTACRNSGWLASRAATRCSTACSAGRGARCQHPGAYHMWWTYAAVSLVLCSHTRVQRRVRSAACRRPPPAGGLCTSAFAQALAFSSPLVRDCSPRSNSDLTEAPCARTRQADGGLG